MGINDPDDHPNKIIITEDTPLIAWFYEIVLRFLYVEAEVLHSGLSQPDRISLVRRFNDAKDPLKALILVYTVGAQGVNLDPC